MMSEEDIKNHHKQIEELKNKKSKGPDDNRGPLDLTKRIEILELLVTNLMHRIIELEKNNSDLQINTTYDWSTATKKELINSLID